MVREKTRFIPVNPDKRGRSHIFMCERCECKLDAGCYTPEFLEFNFCPWCGAEIEGGEENE